MKYLIIGNSTAAVGCIEGIRRHDTTGEITVIAGEPHHTYSRPLISYYLQGKVSDLSYRPCDFYQLNGVTVVYDQAVSVDSENKSVTTADGKVLPYDKLLVATGSTPTVPDYSGLENVTHKFTFSTLDDALAIEKQLDPTKRVLILGAGLVGLKCAEGLVARVASVTVVVRSPKILSAVLDDASAKMVQTHLEHNGIAFKLTDDVSHFEHNTAITEKGEKIDFDILVLAKGMRANTHLLNGIAEIDRGIVVNHRSETTAPHIYAAGDCTQSNDASSGQSKVMALLPNAYLQGECAGINMAGAEHEVKNNIPMNAVGFFGKHIMTAGNYSGEEYVENQNGVYKCLFLGYNKLNGFILVGDTQGTGIYTNIIRNQIPLDTLDAESLCKTPSLSAYDKSTRQKIIGGTLE
ncbi:MAG: FAD-dependent oxidoreductase [Oscillospiraceae bacterium]|nr:FAD-dependent oxidoreductase [Oscillospiraceae bacterium]